MLGVCWKFTFFVDVNEYFFCVDEGQSHLNVFIMVYFSALSIVMFKIIIFKGVVMVYKWVLDFQNIDKIWILFIKYQKIWYI